MCLSLVAQSVQWQGYVIFPSAPHSDWMRPTMPPKQWVPGPLSGGWRGQSVKLITDIHLVRMLRMREAIPPLPHTSSWRGASLSTETLPPLYSYRLPYACYMPCPKKYKKLKSIVIPSLFTFASALLFQFFENRVFWCLLRGPVPMYKWKLVHWKPRLSWLQAISGHVSQRGSTRGLTDWLTDWLASWLAGWLAGWLTGWLADWLADWLASWLADWLTDWLTGWLADWLANWPTVSCKVSLTLWLREMGILFNYLLPP
jgi:hypothetical protein